MKTNHIIEKHVTGRTEYHNFGLKDRKGREFGLNIYTFESVVVEGAAPMSSHYHEGTDLPPGRLYSVRCHVTRDGENYGALSRTKSFSSEKERDAYISKRYAAALTRAAKG